MMQGRFAALVVLALAGCVEATPPDEQAALPPGYPPQIGTVQATLNGEAHAWDTYDYSIGAFDASVQVMDFNGETQFRLMGETPGHPDDNRNRLLIKAVMKSPTKIGTLTQPVIEIVAGKNWDGVRLTSIGAPVTLVLDSLTPMNAGSYGHVTGHFSATMCDADGQPPQINRARCQPFSGTFDSDLQISGR